jgi:hypothetical protein
MFHVKHITGIFRSLEDSANPPMDGDFRSFQGQREDFDWQSF